MTKEESIYETYVREICSNCKNKHKQEFNITRTIDNKIKCVCYKKERNDKNEDIKIFSKCIR